MIDCVVSRSCRCRSSCNWSELRKKILSFSKTIHTITTIHAIRCRQHSAHHQCYFPDHINWSGQRLDKLADKHSSRVNFCMFAAAYGLLTDSFYGAWPIYWSSLNISGNHVRPGFFKFSIYIYSRNCFSRGHKMSFVQ